MSPFRQVLNFAKPYKGYLGLNVLFNILYSLMSIVSVTSLLPILKILFDNVKPVNKELQSLNTSGAFNFDNLQNHLINWISKAMTEHGQLKVLAWLCGITVGLFLLRNLFRYLAVYFMVAFRTGVSRDLRNALYNKILSLPVSYFTEQKKGDLITRVSSDVDYVQGYVLMPIVEVFRAPFMILATLAMLIFMNWELTLAALIILPIMGFVISSISKSLRQDARKAQNVLGIIISKVEETLNASKIIKIFNAEKSLSKTFNQTTTSWRSLTNRVERKYELASPTSELLGSFTIIVLVWFGGRLIIEGNGLSGEAFLTFLGLFFQLLDPAKSLTKVISDVSRGSASVERVMDVLNADTTVNEPENPKIIHEFEYEIEFKNVDFAYEENNFVIKDFNLKIPKGKSVALVGQSGSGKTTVANLLTRFYDVTSGEILIDGIPIKELSLSAYRSLLGMVTQESVLFNDTVGNNIAMGKSDASQEEIQKAAEIANAHEFIYKLPLKYQESIGEGGSKLSGGQKQRISIARAVLKNPPIMILDEATSALDTHSERLVQVALEQMMSNRTSLIIAHRLSTIQNVDKIVVMDSGRILEQGNHSELIQKNGMYAKLIEMQNFS